MKHAKNLFAEAVSQLIEMGEKQRKLLQDKEETVDHSDRETVLPIRVRETRTCEAHGAGESATNI